MITVEVKFPSSAEPRRVQRLVLRTCKDRGLVLSVETSLKSYPGSVHWHFKKEKERGTIEVTYWRHGSRLWISVHSNRQGDWTGEEVRGLKTDLEARLA